MSLQRAPEICDIILRFGATRRDIVLRMNYENGRLENSSSRHSPALSRDTLCTQRTLYIVCSNYKASESQIEDRKPIDSSTGAARYRGLPLSVWRRHSKPPRKSGRRRINVETVTSAPQQIDISR